MAETKKSGMGWVIIGSLVAVGAGIAVAAANSNKTSANPPPGGTPGSITIKAINLPSGATQWGCAIRDPSTQNWIQPSGHPITGSWLLAPSQDAPFDLTFVNSTLSIVAFAGATLASVTTVASYQVPITIEDGKEYIFDFATGILS